MSNEQLSGYTTISVLLLKSDFYRERQIDFKKKIESQVDVLIEVGLATETQIVSTVIFKYDALIEEAVVFSAEISFSGTFEKIGEPSIPPDKFAELNGPAIIFPFIREHLATLSMKSGFNTIFLPPINIVALANARAQKNLEDKGE